MSQRRRQAAIEAFSVPIQATDDAPTSRRASRSSRASTSYAEAGDDSDEDDMPVEEERCEEYEAYESPLAGGENPRDMLISLNAVSFTWLSCWSALLSLPPFRVPLS